MKKNYLFGFVLFLLAFFSGKSANAQDGNTTTKNISTYSGLVEAVKGVSDAAASKEKVSELEAEMKRCKNIMDAVNPKYITSIDKVSDVHNALSKYYNTIAMASGQVAADETEISYAIGVVKEQVGFTKKDVYTLYVTVPGVSKDIEVGEKTNRGISGFCTAKAQEVYNAIEAAGDDGNSLFPFAFSSSNDVPVDVAGIVVPTKLVIVFKTNNNGSVKFSSPTMISTTPEEERMGVFSPTLLNLCLDKSQNLLSTDASYYSSEEVIEKDDEGKDKMTTAYAEAKVAYEAAEKSYNDAKAKLGDYEYIKTLNITADINIEETDDAIALSDVILPAGITLNGGNYCITGISTTPLLAENKGDIKNLIATDGSIAAKNSGYVDRVIVKAGTGKMRVYSENVSADYDDIPSLVKANSGVYGYDLTAKKIEPVTATNRLYTATYYSANIKDGKTYDVNIKDGKLVDGYDSDDENYPYHTNNNQFIYIKDSHIAEGVVTQENVVVNGVCHVANIVEGRSQAEFYIPTDFTAKTLKYGRNITSDVASACLPFELGQEFLSANERLGLKYYGYKGIDTDTKTVWFSSKSKVEANTPCVLAFEKGSTPGQIFNGLKNVNFKSTVGADLALYPTDQALGENGKRFRGNYKPAQTTGDLAQAAGNLGSEVYGFSNGKLLLLDDKAYVNQFRSFVIYSVGISKSAMLQAGFLDEDGNEVTAVGSVNADRNDNGGLKAVGGNGVIEINADKACNVKVYTVGGTFVKSINVEAGNTSLPVSAGIYIVNKSKVIVK